MGEVPQVVGDLALSQDAGSDLAMDVQTTGSGAPVTCFVPGLGQTIADTRPFGSAVVGSKVFVDLLSRVEPTSDGSNPLERLASDVAEVVKATAATRAVGVSLGAGVLVALAARRRDLFERMVLALPPSLDRQSRGDDIELAGQLADAIDANDQTALTQLLLEMQPPSARTRTDVRIWARRHAALIGGTGVSEAFRVLPGAPPSVTTEQLGQIDVPVLVLAQRDDPWHPLSASEHLVSMLPNARLVVSDVSWVWGARHQLRGAITEFLNS